jgi:hypothetical protein
VYFVERTAGDGRRLDFEDFLRRQKHDWIPSLAGDWQTVDDLSIAVKLVNA